VLAPRDRDDLVLAREPIDERPADRSRGAEDDDLHASASAISLRKRYALLGLDRAVARVALTRLRALHAGTLACGDEADLVVRFDRALDPVDLHADEGPGAG
jgi:hypothetical protein